MVISGTFSRGAFVYGNTSNKYNLVLVLLLIVVVVVVVKVVVEVVTVLKVAIINTFMNFNKTAFPL